MKKLLTLFSLVLALVPGVLSQVSDPIQWVLRKEKPGSIRAGEQFNVSVIATIADGWHLYALEQPEGGPIATRLSVSGGQTFRLAGDIESPLPQVVFDPNFNLETQFYQGEAIFTLPIEVSKDAPPGKDVLSVTAFYQTCNARTCLPPKTVKVTFELDVIGSEKNSPPPGVSAVVTTPAKPQAYQADGANASKAVDFDFVDFSGRTRKFSEFYGKYVLLDFWASWCTPCLADIPKLKDLYEKYKTSGFEIVGMDSETIGDEAPDPSFATETAKRARQIVASRGVTWTQATSVTAVPVAVKVFGVKSLPTKILLDRNGIIIATIGEKDDLTAIVEKLVNPKK